MVLPDLNFTPPEEDDGPHEEENAPPDENDAEMGEHNPEQEDGGGQQMVKHRNSLSDRDRYAAYVAMHALCMRNGGKFKRNDKKDIAAFFKADLQIIQRIWRMAMLQIAEGLEVDVSNKRKGRCGRKPINIDWSIVPTIPLNKRSTIRSLAWQLGVCPATLFTRLTLQQLTRRSNSLKPALKEKNKKERLEFCMSMIDDTTRGDAAPKLTSMHNMVHIDEKWFYMTKKDRNYYLLPEKDVPIRSVHNKNCIAKVMFLTAIARPRFDGACNVTFSGKIGIWPFVKEIPAARKSDNRPKGTMEIKSVKVTRDVMREFIIEKVLHAIVVVWPAEDVGQTILIQQDNATPHLLPSDQAFKAAVAEVAAKTGLTMKLIQQPPNSPDLNALDLGFFRSIESLTDTGSPKTLQEFIQGVQQEFDEYKVSTLNKIFLSLQVCMIEIMNHGGGNGYDLPHVNKARLERLGLLPKRLKIPSEVYANAKQILQAAIKLEAKEQEAKEQARSDNMEVKKKQRKEKQVRKKQDAIEQKAMEQATSEQATSDKMQVKKRQRKEKQMEKKQDANEQDANEQPSSDKMQVKKRQRKEKQVKKKQDANEQDANEQDANEQPSSDKMQVKKRQRKEKQVEKKQDANKQDANKQPSSDKMQVKKRQSKEKQVKKKQDANKQDVNEQPSSDKIQVKKRQRKEKQVEKKQDANEQATGEQATSDKMQEAIEQEIDA